MVGKNRSVAECHRTPRVKLKKAGPPYDGGGRQSSLYRDVAIHLCFFAGRDKSVPSVVVLFHMYNVMFPYDCMQCSGNEPAGPVGSSCVPGLDKRIHKVRLRRVPRMGLQETPS